MRILLLALVLLFAAPSFAFIMTVPDETIPIPVGSSKQIDIKIDSGKADQIQFTLLDPKPWVSQSDSIMRINGDETKFLRIFVSPFQGTPSSVYRLSILAESLITGEQQKKFIFVSVSKLDTLQVEKIDIAGNFTPTGQVSVTVFIKNYKSFVLQDVRITSSIDTPSAELIEFDQNLDSVDPDETKNITYTFTIPRESEAGVYTVNVRTAVDGEESTRVRTFSVASESKFVQESVSRPLLMGFSKTISVTNIGNTKDDAIITGDLSPFEEAFYSGDTPASTKGGFTWLLKDVAPGETRTIEYKADFSPLFLFILVLLVAAWLFFFKVRALKIKKFILEKKFIEEGEEFTVGIELSNASGRKFEDITVKDFVPSVFEFKEGEGPKPAKKKTAAGTELTWKVKDLHKNEERILSYKILPVFGVHGTVRLPQASAGFKSGKRQSEIKSLYTTLGIETENYGEHGVFKRKK